MTKRKLAMVLILGGGLLASCNGDNGSSVNDVTINQVRTSTCTTNTPIDINSLNLSDDQSQVDVTNLTPGCNLPGG